jgi:hypothetical protein
MSNTSCHFGRYRTGSGTWQAARRWTSASQLWERNSRQSSGQLARSVTALTDTPAGSWPSCPACRSTGAAPHRVVAVLGKAGVVHRPRRRPQRSHQPLGQTAADRPPVPRADRHEMVQRLVVDLAEALGHRLHRLAPAIQHQPAQVALPRARWSLCGNDSKISSAKASRRPRIVASSPGVTPPRCLLGGPEGASTHTPSVRRKPDTVLAVLR